MQKYDKIGKDYNSTRKADPYLTGRIHHHLRPNRSGIYLDIGCGTGNYTIALNHKGYQFLGLDPSQKMLDIARSKSESITWIKGFSENVTLKDHSVDGAIATLTIHHWKELGIGMKEIHRVLNDQSRLVIFTSSPLQMKGYWLNHYFPQMLKDSISQMPEIDDVMSILENCGFKNVIMEKYDVKDDLEDLFLYAGKNRPSLYLNKEIRSGISSFSALANSHEVEKGLNELNKDIKSKKIINIIEKYHNNIGDYTFIIGEK